VTVVDEAIPANSTVPAAPAALAYATPDPDAARLHRRLRRWFAHSSPDYRVGTLTYTRLGLFMMFVWLLWGDLVWSLMETVFPASMPLQLDRIGVGKEWIGYLMGTAGAVINMTFVPVISFRSDRTRTRLGRRIPYILATMPFLCIFLAILGFTDSIGASIRASSLPGKLHLSPAAAIVIVLGVLILLYNVFNVFVNSVYWYLFRDVIPSAYLGRFMAAFRMVGTVANMIWGAFLYGRIETHTATIYVGASIVYFVGFGLMCLMVKEGSYPPPEDYDKSEPWPRKFVHAIRTYARECFSHPLFVAWYLARAVFAVGGVAKLYKQFVVLRRLHFTTADLGRVLAVMSPILLALQWPMGWLVDRIHPMRVYLIASTLLIPVYAAGYFIDTYTIAGYAIHAFTVFVAIQLLQMPLTQLSASSDIPLMMRVFPLAQYGQFSSAQAMLRHFSLIFGTIAGATFIGVMNTRHGQQGNAYSCLWQAAFQALGAVCLWIVYVYWRKLGGVNFTFAPREQTKRGFDVVASAD
jgi:maltose/moltooligosaccharide transporter